MNSKQALVASACIGASIQAVGSPPIDVYTDRGAWEAAVAGVYHEETFDAPKPYWFVATGGNASLFSTDGGALRSTVLSPSGGDNLSFDSPVRAFGGNWDLRPGLPGTGLTLTVYRSDGVHEQTKITITPEISHGSAGGFFGFVSPYGLGTVVSIAGGTQGGKFTHNETYQLDNVVFAGTIPEPGISSLMLVGFGIIGLSCRRQRRAAVRAGRR